MTFPDKIDADFSQWATLVPGRHPEFKLHAKEHLANNAIAQRAPWEECAKYQIIDGAWTKVFERLMPEFCENDWCGNRFTARRAMNRSHTNPRWMAKIICNRCYQEEIYR